jgi:hypothetical protein
MSFYSSDVIDPRGQTASAPQIFLGFQPPRNISAKWRIYIHITSQFDVPNDKTDNFYKFAMPLTATKQPCVCELAYS